MAKKCIYCKSEIPSESVIDFCERCGVGVWGEKMFKTIRDNMQNAYDKGDLRNASSFADVQRP
ncbi:hypothetical protein HY212_07170 [Candidatus Pacearchaeota archaeon]|nr:hypothetical protein [Candidatus Pacearchaeota archaeon]